MKTVGHLMPGELEAAVQAAEEAEVDREIERVEQSIDWPNTEFEAQGDWVLLEQELPPEFTAGGLVIPESARSKHHAFPIVVAVGPDVPDLKPGDQIVMTSNVGISPADYVIIKQPREGEKPIMGVRRKYVVTVIRPSMRTIVKPSEVLQ